jgi:hypothetical protein
MGRRFKMKSINSKFKQINQKHVIEHEHESHNSFSMVVMKIAKRELQEFESQSDEAFLIRAEMDRKLSSF